MTAVVLLILAVIWAAVLVPPWLQARRETRPGDSIASFRNQLSVLQRTTPGHRPVDGAVTRLPRRPAAPTTVRLAGRPALDLAPPRRSEVKRRRRDVFLTLLGAAALTFLLALLLGGPVWGLHVAVDLLFAGYVAMLVKLQQQAAEREQKLRYLPRTAPRRQPEPALLLRRSAN